MKFKELGEVKNKRKHHQITVGPSGWPLTIAWPVFFYYGQKIPFFLLDGRECYLPLKWKGVCTKIVFGSADYASNSGYARQHNIVHTTCNYCVWFTYKKINNYIKTWLKLTWFGFYTLKNKRFLFSTLLNNLKANNSGRVQLGHFGNLIFHYSLFNSASFFREYYFILS